MDAKIDFVSFTLLEDLRGAGDARLLQQAVVAALWQRFPAFAAWSEQRPGWKPAGARGHYSDGLFHPTLYTAIRYGGSANHILVEMPGTACQDARDAGFLQEIISQAADRMTRLDVAIDVPGGCSPAEFVAAGYNARFKSHASLVSEDGTTEYVGSMKSERFARVYRYNAPHPRAGTLRIEHVFRSDYAKSAAGAYQADGLLHLAAAAGNSFGWRSATWQPEALTDTKLRASRSDRHQPGRIRWLLNVCIPALVKADQEGLLQLDEVIERLSAVKRSVPAAPEFA